LLAEETERDVIVTHSHHGFIHIRHLFLGQDLKVEFLFDPREHEVWGLYVFEVLCIDLSKVSLSDSRIFEEKLYELLLEASVHFRRKLNRLRLRKDLHFRLRESIKETIIHRVEPLCSS
jgi:hypothetical protein